MDKILKPKEKFIIFCFSAFVNIIGLTGSIYMLQVYDRVLTTYSIATLIGITILALVLLFMMSIVDAARQWVMIRVANRTVGQIGDAYLPKSLRHPDIMQPAVLNANLAKLKNYLSSSGFFALWDFPWTFVYILLIFWLHWMLGTVAIIGAGILILIAVLNHFSARSNTAQAEKYANQAKFQLAMGNSNVETVKGLRMQDAILERWKRYQYQATNTVGSVQETNAFFTSLTKGIRQSLQVAILGLGAYLVIQQEIFPGVMIAASIIMGRALMPIEQSIGQWRLTREAKLAHQQIKAAASEFPIDDSIKTVPKNINGLLRAENLYYSVNPDFPPLLSDISLIVKPGEMLAIFGKSGSGKSTLVKLLTGALTHTDGKVSLDNLRLNEWPDASLRKAIGYLPQQVQLFPGTIAENIAGLSIDIDSQKVIQAATQANVHDMIMSLPQGYETVLQGNQGVSGGQAQRIAFARALYDDRQVIVIDEPNSALDEEGLKLLLESLKALKKLGKTIVVASHYRPMVNLSDRVLILDHGRVHMFGPTDKVINALSKGTEGKKPSDPQKGIRRMKSESENDTTQQLNQSKNNNQK